MIGRIYRILQTKKDGEKDEDAIRLGVLGAANIAPLSLIKPASKLKSVKVTAIAARNKSKAEAFAKKHGIPRALDSYESLIADPDIDAIYNPLPNGLHAKYTILALKAGKHVLLEKPSASNAEEVKQLIEASKNAAINPRTNSKAYLLVAYHWRFHPLARKARSVVQDGSLGQIKSISAKMCLPPPSMPKSDIRFNANGTTSTLAGGILMDMGCYALSACRYFLNDVKSFTVDSTELNPMFPEMDINDQRQADRYSKAALTLHSNIQEAPVQANIEVGMNWNFGINCQVVGEKKSVYISNFVMPFLYHYVTVTDGKKKTTFKEYGSGMSTYFYQLEAFIEAIKGDEEARKLCEESGSIELCLTQHTIIDSIYEKAGWRKRAGI